MITLWRPRFMRPRQDDRDFRIEWRDQLIRRQDSVISIQNESITDLNHRNQVLQAQLEETCRRKGIRDEENNRLRGEVDKLKTDLEEALGETAMMAKKVNRLNTQAS